MSKKMFWFLVLLGGGLLVLGILVDLAVPQTIFGTALMAVGAVVLLGMLLMMGNVRRHRKADMEVNAAQQGNTAFFHHNDSPGAGL
jgi:hypothetical protein